MLRVVAAIAILSFAGPMMGRASIISVSGRCPPPHIATVQGPSRSAAEVDVPEPLIVFCDGAPSAGGFVETTSPVNVGIWFSGYAAIEIEYRSTVRVDFKNGAGDGFFVPCLTVNYYPLMGARGFAYFGRAMLLSRIPEGGTCSALGLTEPSNYIPFTFGVAADYNVFLTIYNVIPQNANGHVELAGFLVMDAQHNVLADATWNASDLPEPSLWWPVGIALAWGGGLLRLRKHAKLS